MTIMCACPSDQVRVAPYLLLDLCSVSQIPVRLGGILPSCFDGRNALRTMAFFSICACSSDQQWRVVMSCIDHEGGILLCFRPLICPPINCEAWRTFAKLFRGPQLSENHHGFPAFVHALHTSSCLQRWHVFALRVAAY